MCSRAGVRSLLIDLLSAVDGKARPDEIGKAEADKIRSTLTSVSEYPPGSHPVLPENRPYGGYSEVVQ